MKHGGLDAIAAELDSPDGDVRTAAVWCIGTAVKLDLELQNMAIQNGILGKLSIMLSEDGSSELKKKV